jgi:hypothetical protein
MRHQFVLAELPAKEQNLILEKAERLEKFPEVCPVRTQGRFRGHRWFLAGYWLVYYRVVGRTVYIRGLWPARIS